jgi:hypothetical protein
LPLRLQAQIVCNAGHTQIEKILIHTKRETKRRKRPPRTLQLFFMLEPSPS